MDGVKKFFGDNGLSISLFSLFVVCVICQGVTGGLAYSDSLRQAHLAPISPGRYLLTGNFLDGIFSNWEAAILQLAVLIGFSSILRQRGAAHSRKGDDEPDNEAGGPSAEEKLDKLKSERERHQREFGRVRSLSNLYKNSLSLTFLAFFVVLFVIHSFTGWRLYNENQAIAHLAAEGYLKYVASSAFWLTVFQCWEAEFFAIAFYVVASIYLRQDGSPESKKTEAHDDDTGDTNE